MARNVTSFKKGQSGNPGGRPKALIHVQELARAQTEESIATLVEIRDNKKAQPGARAACAIALLDRAWGKPTQMQEMTVNKRDIREWSTQELDDAIAELVPGT